MRVVGRGGSPPRVDLVVVTGGVKSDHSLESGDVFRVQDQEWKLERIACRSASASAC
ncbi:DUF6406 domain-containing protein [Streptomyces sp. NPDC006172]|uniref:DUF6406 domain-containing protein n=1 Tax=Streptomyces sp. NPDC006172 TaxID=3154470 RepID=UPI0033E6FDD3